ncbi:MAG: hypothetical protein IPO03_02320 [Bacteroidetes bacterium]|nr:hypothetical protein [Bacteroidota bacterium]
MSRFRTIVHVDPLPSPLQVESKVYFAGSCFCRKYGSKNATIADGNIT